jgi:hypothetical protein
MRELSKIEKYAKKLADKGGYEIIESERSRYFNVNSRVLRISDHIGSNSSGNLSIIIPEISNGDDDFLILHTHNSGSVCVITFEQAKDMVKMFFFMSSFVTACIQNAQSFETEKNEIKSIINENETLRDENKRLKKIEEEYLNSINSDTTTTILGVPISAFSDGQLRTVQAAAKAALKTLKS